MGTKSYPGRLHAWAGNCPIGDDRPTMPVLCFPESIAMRKPACRNAVASIVALLVFPILNHSQAVDLQRHAETIKIRLIDGRNGHPLADSYVNTWVGRERKEAMVIPTDKDGVALLCLSDEATDTDESSKGCGRSGISNHAVKYDESLRINVGFVLCEPHGGDYSWLKIMDLSTSRVLHEGVTMTNTCGKPNTTAKPGEVIIFVRPLTFWEKLKE
jgi:hypothetical protein